MKLLIKFPTRGRRTKFLEVFNQYIDLCDDIENTKFLITLDVDDEDMNNLEIINSLKSYKNTDVIYGKSKSKIDAVNRDLNFFKNWDIVLLASDDMIPKVKGYDTIIRNNMKENYPDTDGVLWFNDGHQGNKLNTLCILGKKYYKRFNYIYQPEYKSLWADNEFTDVANLLEKQTYFSEVIIKHEHPDIGIGDRDDIHLNNSKNNDVDRNLYLNRKLVNFEL